MIANFFLAIMPAFLCFVMVVINLVRFTVHVYWRENLFKPSQELTNQGYWERLKAATIGCTHTNTRTFDTTTGGQEPVVDEIASDVEIVKDNEVLASSLAMQSFVQCSLYISAFSLCLIAPGTILIMGFLRIPPPDWIFWMASTVWPLGGFLNIIIYTRPKVLQYQKQNPQYSRPHIFLVVVLSGGEVPASIDLGDSDNDFEEKSEVLKQLMRNILDYRANRDDAEEKDDAERKPVISSTPSERVLAKSQDSIYGSAVQNYYFSENPSTADDHSLYHIDRIGVDEHIYSNSFHCSSCQNSGAIAWVHRDCIESQFPSEMSCMTES